MAGFVAVDWPVLTTPAFEVDTVTAGSGYYGWYGSTFTPVPGHLRLRGGGLFAEVTSPNLAHDRLEFVAAVSSRAWNAKWDTGNELITTQVASAADVGFQVQIVGITVATDVEHTFYPVVGFRAGLAGTTIHATNEGTLTAFGPHFAVDAGVAIGEGVVRAKLAVSADAIARMDGWGSVSEMPVGNVSWQINAGSASMRAFFGIEIRPGG